MQKIVLPKIGMRTLKTALAIFLCLLLLPGEPFFACLTSVFCIQDTIENSIKMAFTRGIGTILGGVSGLGFLFLFKSTENIITNDRIEQLLYYIVISLGIIFVIYCCNILNTNPAINISCIAFLAVTTAHANADPLNYAVNRITETLLGILIGLLVNRFLLNPSTKKEN